MERRVARTAQECTFAAHDGVQLFFRYWPALGDRRGAIVLLHRGHEHSGRVAHIVEELNLPDQAFFAWDARAHGRSAGEAGGGTSMATFVQDLDEFVRHIRAAFELAEEEIAVVAQSLGAVMAAAWVHDYAPQIRCLVLAAPAFRVKLYVPFARLGLAAWQAVKGDFFVQSYVKGAALTHDAERAASYATDPLIRRPIAVRVLLSLDQMAQRVVDDAAAIRVPVQMLLSGSDWVVDNRVAQRFYDRLGTSEREVHHWPGFYHDTLGERDRQLPLAKVRAFLERRFDGRPSLLAGAEFTRAEYRRLRQPLAPWSWAALSFAGTRLFLRTIGRWSEGIGLGLKTGFDSGASLDYVYRNEVGGFNPLGQMIDWFYLNAVGWRGVRVRRQMLEELLARAMGEIYEQRRGVRVLDIAAGHGRYVLEGVGRSGVRAESILLRDLDGTNVYRLRDAISRLPEPLKSVTRFEQADAFDRAAFQSIEPTVNVGIVSGLYELFPDNTPVRASLAGLAGVIEKGGFLLYTGQPWHPQLEMIARTLNSHRGGQPWVMRRRTQEELDELVREAGFRKVEQRIDPTGLFTVSRAERI